MDYKKITITIFKQRENYLAVHIFRETTELMNSLLIYLAVPEF